MVLSVSTNRTKVHANVTQEQPGTNTSGRSWKVEGLHEARQEAESLTQRICAHLDAIADNYTDVMPLIHEAITSRAWAALGYRSPGHYVLDRFGHSLTRVGIEARREVVRELSAAGLSTRAIASVVGTTHKTVVKDRQALSGGTEVPPQPSSLDPEAHGETVDEAPIGGLRLLIGGRPSGAVTPHSGRHTTGRRTTLGIDGKTYERTAPTRRRRPLPDQFSSAMYDLRKLIDRLERLESDDRFSANRESLARHRSDLARACEALNRIANQLPPARIAEFKTQIATVTEATKHGKPTRS